MADTCIKEDFGFRRVGGGLLIFIGLPLTLIVARFALPSVQSASDVLFLLPAPMLVAAGLWAAFPRRKPDVRMTISDEAVTLHATNQTLPLDSIQSIRLHMPALAKYYRLTFQTMKGPATFDIVHLTHEGPDILNLIGIRLEERGRYLLQARSEVLGALTDTWQVQTGTAFETTTEPLSMSGQASGGVADLARDEGQCP